MVYIIYDTALNGQYTLLQLQESYPVNDSLFAGSRDEALTDVAPYVIRIDADFKTKLQGPLISLHQLIFVETEDSLTQVIQHFQPFIYKKREDKEYFFRFWDARVLSKFLSNESLLNPERFFGASKALLIEDADDLLRFELNRKNKVFATRIPAGSFFEQIQSGPNHPEQNSESLKAEQPAKPKRRFFVE